MNTCNQNDHNMIVDEPPNKRIKNEFENREFIDWINNCYDLKFRQMKEIPTSDIEHIREVLLAAKSSIDVPWGRTKAECKINWGKCLGILIEDGARSLGVLKKLTDMLNPGGGLFDLK